MEMVDMMVYQIAGLGDDWGAIVVATIYIPS